MADREPPAAPAGLPELRTAPLTTVAVRALCEFTAKRGDLDLRFTPSPTGAEGVEGHGVVTARRPAGYQTEVPLAGDWGVLRVRGRADGWDPAARRLEEIKTHRGDLAHQPDNHRALHWAQARVYGALICRQLGLAQVELALVYFNIDTCQETVFEERADADHLLAFVDDLCRRFADWSTQEAAHRRARDEALAALAFPMPSFQAGQRELAEAVYRAVRAGRCLMAQAPTGIGKCGCAVPGVARHAATGPLRRAGQGLLPRGPHHGARACPRRLAALAGRCVGAAAARAGAGRARQGL